MEEFYVLSWSRGKDSSALLVNVLQKKMPLHAIVTCDIMFDEHTSGEHPLMAKWLDEAEERVNYLLKKFGYEHVKIIHLTAKRNFLEQFYTVKRKGNHIGDNYGFPYIIGAWCNSKLKLDPTSKYINNLLKQGYCVTEYVGIASDEPKRLKRYKVLTSHNHKYITLAKFMITEQKALRTCKYWKLLSPKYENSFRCGCWFCPKQSLYDLYNLWKNHSEYFERLLKIEKDSHNTFKPGSTLAEIKARFESGYIPKRKR